MKANKIVIRKNLGQIVGELMRLEANIRFNHLDVSMWDAPSECHNDVERGHEEAVEAILIKHNITIEEIEVELKERGLSGHNLFFGFKEAGWSDKMFYKDAREMFGKYFK